MLNETVIYHVLTSYQFFECLTHHISTSRDRNCIFIVPKDIRTRVPQIDEFKEKEFFNALIEIEPMYGFSNTVAECKKNIKNYYDDLLKSIDFSCVTAIYVAAAYRNFAFYLTTNKIKFCMFEDASGTLFRKDQQNYDKINLPAVYNAISNQQLYDGLNISVTKIYCDMNAQSEIDQALKNKLADFNVVSEFKLLDKNIQDKILDIYGAKISFNQSRFSLVLTQWFIFDNKLSTDKRIPLHYQYLCDIFLEGQQAVIKPHPNDPIDYSHYFNDIIVKGKFPSELLLCQNGDIERVISINSTANNAFEKYAKRNIRLKTDPFSPIAIYNKLIVVFDLLQYFKEYEIRFYGIEDDFFKACSENLIDKQSFWVMPKNICGKTILVVDHISWGQGTTTKALAEILHKANKECIFIFLNRNENCDFWNIHMNEITEFFTPVRIKTESVNPTVYSNIADEIIWIYTKNNEIKNRLANFKAQKYLPHVGILLTAETLSENESEILILKQKIKSISQYLINSEK